MLLPKFVTGGLLHRMMYLNCPRRFTPMTFIERLVH